MTLRPGAPIGWMVVRNDTLGAPSNDWDTRLHTSLDEARGELIEANRHITAAMTPWRLVEVHEIPTAYPHLADAAPAEDWEPVTADQVRVGDWVEVTREWETGATATYRGTVQALGADHQWAELAPTCNVNLLGAKAIRRRVRQPMAEPDAPAVVRHAGHVLTKGIRSDWWWDLTEEATGGRCWADVLALDPTTDPVVVDLGSAS